MIEEVKVVADGTVVAVAPPPQANQAHIRKLVEIALEKADA